MAKKLSELSSEELFEMARQRADEEEAAEKESMRAQIDELRAQRKQMIARHRKELATMDAEIRAMGGRVGGGRGRKRGGNGVSVTEQVLDIVSQNKKISTKEIKAALEERGIIASNLAQTLAYLKKQGRVTSPARSVYSPA